MHTTMHTTTVEMTHDLDVNFNEFATFGKENNTRRNLLPLTATLASPISPKITTCPLLLMASNLGRTRRSPFWFSSSWATVERHCCLKRDPLASPATALSSNIHPMSAIRRATGKQHDSSAVRCDAQLASPLILDLAITTELMQRVEVLPLSTPSIDKSSTLKTCCVPLLSFMRRQTV